MRRCRTLDFEGGPSGPWWYSAKVTSGDQPLEARLSNSLYANEVRRCLEATLGVDSSRYWLLG